MKFLLLYFTKLFFVLSLIFTLTAGQSALAQKTYKISSPNRKLSIHLTQAKDGTFSYSVKFFKMELIQSSPMGYKLKGGENVPSAGWKVENSSRKKVNSVWKPVWGKRSIVPEKYNELTVSLSTSTDAQILKMQLLVRAYNDGVAFRYKVPETEQNNVQVESELTAYNFAGDYTAWFYNGEDQNIGPEKLSESTGNRLPVMTIEADKTHYMAIHEADLTAGDPLVLHSEKGKTQFNVVSKPGKLFPGYASAWRVILLGTTPGELVDSHMIELLNPAPSPELDFSWVKPGVAVWDWRIDGAIAGDFKYTMSYPSWIRMVDFAAQQGFSHLVLDANWYGPEHESGSDPVKGDKANDVQKLLAYAKEKGVGIWLYLNDVGGKKYPIEETLKQYGEWGAAGVKYGFMKGSMEEKNLWTRKITELCAKNHLLVDFHDGPVHPYGQMRTWPNAVTREYCHAQLDAHRVFVPKTFVTTVFVNMLAGPIDMNNGMFDLRQGNTTRVDENKPVPSTLVSEAARTLIVFSGTTILPDIPEYYRKYPALLEFISAQKMPWIESKTLKGEIGEYIVMMRQTEKGFLVGAATNESERTLDVPLSFLKNGNYELLLIQDGAEGHYLNNRETLKVDKRSVTKKDFIQLKLAPGGGACLLLKPIEKK
jgi:alpha-glucosidase